jgi:general secretion pathway protein H
MVPKFSYGNVAKPHRIKSCTGQDLMKRVQRVAMPRLFHFLPIGQKMKKGFTLIELTVVIFIIGLISLITMPRVGNFLYQSDLKTATRSLKSAVRLTRSKSITTQKMTLLFFDLNQGLYWGAYVGSEDNTQSFLGEKEYLFAPKRLPKGIRFLDAANINSGKRSFGVLSSLFNPKGVFEETVLHLTDQNNQIMTIVINAYTGRFTIYDEYVDIEYGEPYQK